VTIRRMLFAAFVLSPWLGLAATIAVAATVGPKHAPQQPIIYLERVGTCWRDA